MIESVTWTKTGSQTKWKSAPSWKSQLKLVFACGSFSYSEIAKYFDRMMGLTSTLDSIAPAQIAEIKKDFNISLTTFLPSAYGKHKRKWTPNSDTVIVPVNGYFFRIAAEIQDKLMDDKRAVLCCFEDIKTLTEFWDSEPFLKFRSHAQRMTEEASSQEREQIVSLATRAGQVTLITRLFGRGTNFYVSDPVVACGGIHVLQVFVSENPSEEIQIRGMAARQGQPGSYGMILEADSLEKLFGQDVEAEVKEMEATGQVYSRIDAARNRAFEIYHNEEAHGNASRHNLHTQSIQFLLDLRSNNVAEARKFLCMVNNGSETANADEYVQTYIKLYPG